MVERHGYNSYNIMLDEKHEILFANYACLHYCLHEQMLCGGNYTDLDKMENF